MPRLAFLILLLPAACAVPYVPQPPGPWSGAPEPNDWNLSAMVANPQDLSYGQGTTASIGDEAGPPVTRLLSGRRKPLLRIGVERAFQESEAPGETGGGAAGVGQ